MGLPRLGVKRGIIFMNIRILNVVVRLALKRLPGKSLLSPVLRTMRLSCIGLAPSARREKPKANYKN